MRKYEFDAAKTKDEIVEWIRNYFRKNGPDCNAVIGISGGKDSSIVAALCCEALGNGRVIGVLMPQGAQSDIDVARELVKHLGIKSFEINIAETVNMLLAKGRIAGLCDSKQARVNLTALKSKRLQPLTGLFILGGMSVETLSVRIISR